MNINISFRKVFILVSYLCQLCHHNDTWWHHTGTFRWLNHYQWLPYKDFVKWYWELLTLPIFNTIIIALGGQNYFLAYALSYRPFSTLISSAIISCLHNYTNCLTDVLLTILKPNDNLHLVHTALTSTSSLYPYSHMGTVALVTSFYSLLF